MYIYAHLHDLPTCMKPIMMIAAASPLFTQFRKTVLVNIQRMHKLAAACKSEIGGKVNGIAALGLQTTTAPAKCQYCKAWQISQNLPEFSLRY